MSRIKLPTSNIWKSKKYIEEGEGRGFDEDAVGGESNKTRSRGGCVGYD
jgi:hypothetical protein